MIRIDKLNKFYNKGRIKNIAGGRHGVSPDSLSVLARFNSVARNHFKLNSAPAIQGAFLLGGTHG